MRPKPTHEYIRSLLNYDPETGDLTWKRKLSKKTVVGKKAGTIRPDKGLQVSIDGKLYKNSVVIWFWVHGHWPKGPPYEIIDHIDRNPANNRLSNLRMVSSEENNWNMKVRYDNPLGVRGVRYDLRHGRYQAWIQVRYKFIHLGMFPTLKEAAEARAQAEVKYRGATT